MKQDENGDVKLSEIAKELGMDASIANNFLFGLAGYPKLGKGLTVNNKETLTRWTMSKKDADEFIRRVKAYITETAVETHKIYRLLNI